MFGLNANSRDYFYERVAVLASLNSRHLFCWSKLRRYGTTVLFIVQRRAICVLRTTPSPRLTASPPRVSRVGSSPPLPPPPPWWPASSPSSSTSLSRATATSRGSRTASPIWPSPSLPSRSRYRRPS